MEPWGYGSGFLVEQIQICTSYTLAPLGQGHWSSRCVEGWLCETQYSWICICCKCKLFLQRIVIVITSLCLRFGKAGRMLEIYSSSFSNNAQQIGYLLLETATKKFTITFSICFIKSDSTAWPTRSRQLDFCRLLKLVPFKQMNKCSTSIMQNKANFLKLRLLRIISDCEIDLVAAVLAFGPLARWIRQRP